MRGLGVLLLIAAGSGCYGPGPHCLSNSDTEVLGSWRYRGERPVAEMCRPGSISFNADGTFAAHYEGCVLSAFEQQHLQHPASDDVTGRWRAGDYCVDRLFVPTVVIETDPPVPNTVMILIQRERLSLVGGASGYYDASYYRETPD